MNQPLWKPRDLTIAILLAVASFVYTVLVGQLGNLFTGIVGLNFIFIIGHSIFMSFGFLIYEKKVEVLITMQSSGRTNNSYIPVWCTI
jgi:hypothetical protein